MTTPTPAPEGLLPCPFCGSAPRVFNHDGSHGIECYNPQCGAMPGVACHENFGGAAEAFNRWQDRTPVPPAQPAGAVSDAMVGAGCRAAELISDQQSGREPGSTMMVGANAKAYVRGIIAAAIAANKGT